MPRKRASKAKRSATAGPKASETTTAPPKALYPRVQGTRRKRMTTGTILKRNCVPCRGEATRLPIGGAPTAPYQDLTIHPVVTDENGNATVVILPSLHRGVVSYTVNVDGSLVSDSAAYYDRASYPKITRSARYRVVGCVANGLYVHSSLEDQGYVQIVAMDGVRGTTGTGDNTSIVLSDYTSFPVSSRYSVSSLKHGVSFRLTPQDMETAHRLFNISQHPASYMTPEASNIAQETLAWSTVRLDIRGAKANTAVMRLELLTNYEFSFPAGSFASQLEIPAVPADSGLMDRISSWSQRAPEFLDHAINLVESFSYYASTRPLYDASRSISW